MPCSRVSPQFLLEPRFEPTTLGYKSNALSIKATTAPFGSVGRCQILLENEISIFKKLVGRRKHEVLQTFLVNWCSDVAFQHTGPTPADDIAPQIITDYGTVALDFKQLGL